MIILANEKNFRLIIKIAPMVMVVSYALLLYIPFTKEFAVALLNENRLIEITTFLFLWVEL